MAKALKQPTGLRLD